MGPKDPKVGVRNKFPAFLSSIPHDTCGYWLPTASWHPWNKLKFKVYSLHSLWLLLSLPFLLIDSSQALIDSSQAGFARREMTLQGTMRSRNISISKRSWVSCFFKTWDINPSLASAQRLQKDQGTENRWRIISSKGTPWTGYPSGEQQNHHPKWEIQWFVD